MAKLIPCSTCGRELSASAAACPHCGEVKKRAGWIKKLVPWTLAALGTLVVLAAFLGEDQPGATTAGVQGAAATTTPQLKVGTPFRTDQFEIEVSSVQMRDAVGTEFMNSRPAEGAIYVAVAWKYKNISHKPVSAFETPIPHLVDAAGNTYDADIEASGNFASEHNDTEKVLSDLNPGISVTTSTVFEVSKELFSPQTWRVMIDADSEAYLAF